MIVTHKLILTVVVGNLIWIHVCLVHLAVADLEVWSNRLRVKSVHDTSLVLLSRYVELNTVVPDLSIGILLNWNACSSLIELAKRARYVECQGPMRLCALNNPMTTYRLVSSLHHLFGRWLVVLLQRGYLVIQTWSRLQVLWALDTIVLLLHQMVVQDCTVAWRACAHIAS